VVETLIIALDKSLLIWIGMWILLGKRYKIHTFLTYVALTSLFTYFGTMLIGQWVRPLLFAFTFAISNYRVKGFIEEAKINFFHLALIFMIMMLGRAWADLITYLVVQANGWDQMSGYTYGYQTLAEAYGPSLSLLFKIIICVVFIIIVKIVLIKTGISAFLKQIDEQRVAQLAGGVGVILLGYYGVILIPIGLEIACSGMTRMQPIYMTLLTLIAAWIIHLFKELFREQILLNKSKETLADRNKILEEINHDLTEKESEIIEKQSLIEGLDKKIMDIGQVQKQLRDFEHGQLELLTALVGGIESGDKLVMYSLLDGYGTKVQEVLKCRPEFPDVNQLVTTELMSLRFFLLSKANLAIKKGIEFTIEMPEEIKDIGMPVLDLIEILGVWINNAIEEAEHTVQKWVHISFIFERFASIDTVLEIRVTNSCRKQTINPSLLTKQDVTTKGVGRGSGLRIVEEMMMKYEQVYVSTQVSSDKFMQLLEIGL